MPDIQMAPYVLGAYMGIWLVIAGYLGYLAFKISKAQKEIKHLSETVKKH
jgi:CcmD family protein